ncbi:MAG: flagellar basal body protein [Caulobacteraceae bacterium]|nr:flagellar basal body protein [Caulobacteraceae bacterium]
MNPATAALTLKALDGLSTRAEVTAENIANAATPGYRPLQVSFEAALSAAAARGPGTVGQVTPKVGPQTGLAAQGLRLDLELATAASTAMRYSALIEVLGRQLQIDSLAITGNA